MTARVEEGHAQAAGGLLDRMAKSSRARVRAARAAEPEGRLLARAKAMPPPPPLALDTFDLIAELKLRSPSAGGLARQGLDRDAQIAAYCAGGAAAISVLTEPEEFGGSLEHLRDAAALAATHGRPVMRKDFLTDPYQVVEARAAGAGGVLIIVTMLPDPDVRALLDAARELGLFALLEGFDADDLERISALEIPPGSPPVLAGVNCRNLRTLDVDFGRFAELAPRLPAGLPAVAESGIDSPDGVRSVVACGYRLALVGSALMRAASPRQAVADLVAAGREAGARSHEP
ncbi:MAG: indole-3-glycerol-phosphate synthase [Gammaproteobacteria bacterium]|nr:indole-3-glycerol-phosphate synthase TrpC [Gammaproteobacteria bacterium]